MVEIFNIEKHKLNYNFIYNTKETNALKEVFTEIRHNRNLRIDDLRRVALWKIGRVLDISEEIISDLDELAKSNETSLDNPKTIKIIESLTNCQGVGIPMASAILKFLRRDIFPIIDVRAYRALTGKKIRYNQYSVSIYIEYVKMIYEIREKVGLPLDVIDEQLYCFDKEKNGKI